MFGFELTWFVRSVFCVKISPRPFELRDAAHEGKGTQATGFGGFQSGRELRVGRVRSRRSEPGRTGVRATRQTFEQIKSTTTCRARHAAGGEIYVQHPEPSEQPHDGLERLLLLCRFSHRGGVRVPAAAARYALIARRAARSGTAQAAHGGSGPPSVHGRRRRRISHLKTSERT